MAAFDTNRAAFVQQEYRYATKPDNTVLARNKSARAVEVITNLDQSSAESLAAAILADNGNPRAFEIVTQGVTFLDSFNGGVPSFSLNFPKFNTNNRVVKVIGFTSDFETNTTTWQVRG